MVRGVAYMVGRGVLDARHDQPRVLPVIRGGRKKGRGGGGGGRFAAGWVLRARVGESCEHVQVMSLAVQPAHHDIWSSCVYIWCMYVYVWYRIYVWYIYGA